MSKFEEIQEQYKSLRDAEVAYWDRLNEVRKQIREEFSTFLAVDPDEKIGPSGELRLWFGAKKTFGGKTEQDLVQDHNELLFTLNLVLDSKQSSFPPSTLCFRLRLKFEADQYMIKEHVVDMAYTVIKDDFTPFYEHLHQACIQRLAAFTRKP